MANGWMATGESILERRDSRMRLYQNTGTATSLPQREVSRGTASRPLPWAERSQPGQSDQWGAGGRQAEAGRRARRGPEVHGNGCRAVSSAWTQAITVGVTVIICLVPHSSGPQSGTRTRRRKKRYLISKTGIAEWGTLFLLLLLSISVTTGRGTRRIELQECHACIRPLTAMHRRHQGAHTSRR